MTDREKLEKIYEMYEQSMYRVAYSILQSEHQAEDAVSETFVKIVEHIHKIKDVESELTKAYIKKIIKNTSINLYRKSKRERSNKDILELGEYISDGRVEAEFRKIENEENEKYLLTGLSEKYKEVFLLRCMEELSFDEIAQVVDEKPATVRKRYERARKSIMKKISEGGI